MFAEHIDYPEPTTTPDYHMVIMVDRRIEEDSPSCSHLQLYNPRTDKGCLIKTAIAADWFAHNALHDPQRAARISSENPQAPRGYLDRLQTIEGLRREYAERCKEEVSLKIAEEMKAATGIDIFNDVPSVHALIDTPGGSLDMAVAQTIVMQSARLMGAPTQAYAIKAASAGGHLFMNAAERYVIPGSQLFMHPIRWPTTAIAQTGPEDVMPIQAHVILHGDRDYMLHGCRQFFECNTPAPRTEELTTFIESIAMAHLHGRAEVEIHLSGASLSEFGIATNAHDLHGLEKIFVHNSGLDCKMGDQLAVSRFFNFRHLRNMFKARFPDMDYHFDDEGNMKVFSKEGIRPEAIVQQFIEAHQLARRLNGLGFYHPETARIVRSYQ